MKLFSYLLLAGLSVVTLSAYAAESKTDNTTETGNIKAALEESMPGLKIPHEAIKPTPINGLYMVVLPPDIFYVSSDGRYVFDGAMIDMKNRVNLTEAIQSNLRVAAIKNVGEKNMISYGPKSAKHTITVFTDIDCGYCRKLHNEIGDYNKAGIRVRYLAYPRAGVGSDSYKRAVSVWCADDRAEAMTAAKSGGEVPNKDCANPVEMEFKLGTKLGVKGTPAIVTEQGNIIPGYVPAARLKAMLDQSSK